jgi:membrane-associated protease RseP (regulator of RpoE activity)
MRALGIALALVLLAPALAAQSAPPTPRAGWIGFFAGFEPVASGPSPLAVVLAVAEGSPATRVGLVEGDTLLAVDGSPLTPDGLKALAAGLRAGDRVELIVRRDGARRTLVVVAEPRPASQTMMPDPVEIRIGSARRLLEADRVEATPAPAPRARRVLVRSPDVPAPAVLAETEWPTPFSVHVFGDERTDSLVAALREIERRAEAVERRLVAARSAESARVRELAARVTQGGRIDTSDRELSELRRQRQALATEQQLLRAMLERIVAERVEAPRVATARPMEWTLQVAPPAEPTPPRPDAVAPTPATVVRPMTPYIAGRDRVAGARVTPLNPGLAEYFGTARGVLVVEVASGTPAEQGGLRPGDVLLRVGASDVDDLEALRRAVAAAPGDQPVPVALLRKGVRLHVLLPR